MEISAIICVYNEQKTIKDVITSVVNYSFNEVIVINDGSTDKTDEIVCGLSSLPNLKYIALPENMGKGFAMATGVECASGNILVFIDGDLSNLHNEHLFQLTEPLLKKEAHMVLGQPTQTLIKSSINPFKSFTGQRALLKEDIFPIIEKMKGSRFGVETLINLYFLSQDKVIKYEMLEGLIHPTKFDKTTPPQAVKEFIQEIQQVAFSALKNLDLIMKAIKNEIVSN